MTDLRADANAAWVTSRLDFYRQPDWMAQFPFAHTIEMTYRVKDGILEVRTVLNDLSAEPMSVSIGFYPFYRVNDAPRDECTIAIGARTQWILTPQNIPTGETRSIEQLLPNPQEDYTPPACWSFPPPEKRRRPTQWLAFGSCCGRWRRTRRSD